MTIYSLGPLYRIFVFLGSVFFGLAVILTIAHLVSVSESTPVRAFLVLWIAGAIFGVYWYLFRYAYDLRFDSEFLYWRSPLRSGRVLLRDLRCVAVRWGTGATIASVEGGRIHVFAQKGFAKFCAKLVGCCPGLEVRIGSMARFLEWLPGPTLFRG